MGGGLVRVRQLMMVLRKLLKCSQRDYGFCLASVLLLSLASLCYQLNGGAPALILEIRKYLGNSSFLDGYRHVPTKMELMNNVSLGEQPYLYTRHVHFLNFTRFGLQQPVYINIIRDPINRFVSNYFFRRFGDWRSEQNHQIRTPGMKDEERYLDINDCILENYPECNNPRVFYIIPYFCGQHPKCRDPGEWALQKAKENLNENYLLVGILEELEDVLLLLERLLPHYFKDASAVYHSAEYRKLGNGTITVKKQVPSPEALKVLYQRMRYEYNFYNYVKDEFHLLKRKFGLKTGSSTPNKKYEISSQMEIARPSHEDDDDTWLKDIYR
ncbi:uronyl 2-sulfotransferase a isoform X2 [Scyliorhinus canicula]|uniref:uronyl 2-sulfotransferase a isoform X2 n=1 Tax=Scyliorhinus canicula TaxID=7830 RepID=UPI0018F48952|nr:uronyl 2-sulfotransferase a isoform X2 [Scyliorhinus canicula]